MTTYLQNEVRTAMLTQAGHIRPSPLRDSPRVLSKPATGLRRVSRLRTSYGFSRPGTPAANATRMIRALPPPLSRSGRTPDPAGFLPVFRAIAYRPDATPAIRLAAINAIGRFGSASDVPSLREASSSNPALAVGVASALRALSSRSES